jgi:tripartite-type tricarboxylate transporter receptor subunit TctC
MTTTLPRRPLLRLLAVACLGTAFGCSLAPAQAQAWPTRPITLVVPYTPGGTTDNIVRAIQPKLAEQLGQPVVVESRPGASGNVGNRSVARAAPDGYTIGIMPTTVGTFPLMSQTLGYDPMKDFSYIGAVAETPSILVVRKDSPVRTMQDLVKLARSKPDGINVGSGGVGGAGHLVILALGKLNDFAVTHLAYKGTAPALNDVLGGSIDAASMAIGGVKGQVASGIVRPVLVAATERSPLLPDVPVMKEFGLKGVNGGVGYVLAAPAGTPVDVAQKLHAALDRVLQDREVVEKMRALSFVPMRKSMAGAREEVQEQTATWAPLIRELGLKLE